MYFFYVMGHPNIQERDSKKAELNLFVSFQAKVTLQQRQNVKIYLILLFEIN